MNIKLLNSRVSNPTTPLHPLLYVNIGGNDQIKIGDPIIDFP